MRLEHGVKIADLKRSHESHPRNKIIAQVLFRSGMIESFGIGTQEMIALCKQAKKPEPEFFEQGPSFVVRFLSGTKRALQEQDKAYGLSKRQQQILDVLKEEGQLASKEILLLLDDSPAERTLRDDLSFLKEKGYVLMIGAGKNVEWALTEVIGGSGGSDRN